MKVHGGFQRHRGLSKRGTFCRPTAHELLAGRGGRGAARDSPFRKLAGRRTCGDRPQSQRRIRQKKEEAHWKTSESLRNGLRTLRNYSKTTLRRAKGTRNGSQAESGGPRKAVLPRSRQRAGNSSRCGQETLCLLDYRRASLGGPREATRAARLDPGAGSPQAWPAAREPHLNWIGKAKRCGIVLHVLSGGGRGGRFQAGNASVSVGTGQGTSWKF
jgi:hypothetical protein